MPGSKKEKIKPFSIRVEPELRKKMKDLCYYREVKVNWYINNLIKQDIEGIENDRDDKTI